MSNEQEIAKAREYFPRGLFQPEGTFRFSMDALLLARFAGAAKYRSAVDLGTGCGVIGLTMLLENERLVVTGVELQQVLLDAAKQNAEHLGVTERFNGALADVGAIRACGLAAESADVVVSNPPYRRQNQGRHAATQERTCALFETEGALAAFVQAAAFLVKNKGAFCCIFPSERLEELMDACSQNKLTPKRMKFIHSKADQNSTLVLLEARKNGNCGVVVESPLVMYSGMGDSTALTDGTLEYCPYLECNARGR
ncbi:tRNA1(Val) (adenine(37)-N6)-methyltransferase [Halodesulfovibrio marinisediminis]|uniref:tRNA1(Val) A37 N6-methylase TrmN6 n=1 Tax=Halodesulfovibrio marinisediminis DSM 17456 TaxID=1121457 RepID=A0A1N6EYI2_9BACT|nr:methyltransferase [Halodesulfovibrio marinisediminis]SIN88070.1 tRNA1(Val) A37 N6-methylase TrmN6 [Halodesulfovibrio marinisediminis DSM 17456]